MQVPRPFLVTTAEALPPACTKAEGLVDMNVIDMMDNQMEQKKKKDMETEVLYIKVY